MSEKNNKKSNGITLQPKQIAAGTILIILLIGGGLFVGFNWNNWFGDDTKISADIDGDAGDWNGLTEENKEELANKGEGIAIPGYPYINLPKDTTDVQIVLLNPENNPCYFTFDIVLKDTDESIYTSKQVPPGKAITNLTLNKPLAAGTYDAVIKITTNSLTDLSPMNGANIETQLIVN